jgi:predicted phage terminase large subunit-like protein
MRASHPVGVRTNTIGKLIPIRDALLPFKEPGEATDRRGSPSCNRYYLIHVLRDRLIYPDLKRTVVEHGRRFQADSIIVENKGSGISLIDDLRRGSARHDPTPIAVNPEGDEVTRMSAQSVQIEAGKVFLPRDAPWLGELRPSYCSFLTAAMTTRSTASRSFLSG